MGHGHGPLTSDPGPRCCAQPLDRGPIRHAPQKQGRGQRGPKKGPISSIKEMLPLKKAMANRSDPTQAEGVQYFRPLHTTKQRKGTTPPRRTWSVAPSLLGRLLGKFPLQPLAPGLQLVGCRTPSEGQGVACPWRGWRERLTVYGRAFQDVKESCVRTGPICRLRHGKGLRITNTLVPNP